MVDRFKLWQIRHEVEKAMAKEAPKMSDQQSAGLFYRCEECGDVEISVDDYYGYDVDILLHLMQQKHAAHRKIHSQSKEPWCPIFKRESNQCWYRYVDDGKNIQFMGSPLPFVLFAVAFEYGVHNELIEVSYDKKLIHSFYDNWKDAPNVAYLVRNKVYSSPEAAVKALFFETFEDLKA